MFSEFGIPKRSLIRDLCQIPFENNLTEMCITSLVEKTEESFSE